LPHPHPGILIVDVAHPSRPTVVGEIGPPRAGQVGITTRELRVWPQQRLLIGDISKVPSGGTPADIAEGNWNQLFPGAENPANYDADLALHSMAPTADGKNTYLAYLRGGMGVLDTHEVVADTDEVCGRFTAPSFGWPWGWARLISVAQPERPRLVGEYKIVQNTEAFQPSVDPATDNFTSYSSHNPTLTRNLALIAWHSGGLQAIDIADPAQPAQGGWFSPTPLASVANEDPALSAGPNKVVMWSYPIVKDGLIYVIDIRNGLYILRYTGPKAREVASLGFLEGNSNLGDAVRLGRGEEDDR
jgi:hypothetical protein